MARVLGINAVFHDPAAALVVDGETIAAAEEERFSRRKHGKEAVPFSAWELPGAAARFCLDQGGIGVEEIDAVTYSYDPALAPPLGEDVTADQFEGLRTLYAERAPRFLATLLPGLEPDRFRFVPHHVAHAGSAHLASPYPDSAVLVLDGRGERTSHLGGHARSGDLEVLASQALPHSLGLLYEELTEHLGFRRSSDEYKVMALASYGDRERFAGVLRDAVTTDGEGGFRVAPLDLAALAAPRAPGKPMETDHADLAAAVQMRLEEVIIDLATWLHRKTGERVITMAGGVALNCVANARLAAEGPFDHVWVQPAAGDAGTALGGAMAVAHELGDEVAPLRGADLGSGWSDDELEEVLRAAGLPYERPRDLADAVARRLAAGDVVGWFEGRSEYGPRALGHRSLLVDPRDAGNLQRMNDIKGRESFRPVAPMVALDQAADIFEGVIPSPYMLFVHRVRPEWRGRIAAAVHVDGTARAQTIDRTQEPVMARVIDAFAAFTGVPVLINTSFNTVGRPIVDHPREALECFGAGPIGTLVLGPFVVRRGGLATAGSGHGEA
ncbi:MAG TPA: carbamoyltransferase C-terminal domain-containing protein [Acidimicrobiales bacterium]|nr:carbamoyltransferase C-terminal domain-containing protein [Acidimicrobiales bacterium]